MLYEQLNQVLKILDNQKILIIAASTDIVIKLAGQNPHSEVVILDNVNKYILPTEQDCLNFDNIKFMSKLKTPVFFNHAIAILDNDINNDDVINLQRILSIIKEFLYPDGQFFLSMPAENIKDVSEYESLISKAGLNLDYSATLQLEKAILFHGHIYQENRYKVHHKITEVPISNKKEKKEEFSVKNTIIAYGENPLNPWEWQSSKYNLENTNQILEVGCGDGLFWQYKAGELSNKHTVSLTDISFEKVEACKKRISPLITPTRAKVDFSQRDMNDIKGEQNKYDVIICHSVLFFAEYPKDSLSNFRSMVKKGGFVGISVLPEGVANNLFTLGYKLDSNAPAQCFTDKYAEPQADRDISHIFGDYRKFHYRSRLRFQESEPVVKLYQSYPNVVKAKLSSLFFDDLKKEIDKIVDEKGVFNTETGLRLYFASK